MHFNWNNSSVMFVGLFISISQRYLKTQCVCVCSSCVLVQVTLVVIS